MRAQRRLERLEAGLPPRAAVIHWLLQAHEHGSSEDYLTSLLDESGAPPFVGLVERVAAAARAAHAREPRPLVREAERRAVTETVFLAMLVLELAHEASEANRVFSLRLEALRLELRARLAEGKADRRGWATWRAAVLDLATDVARTAAVRRTLEDRYLDGSEVLFPLTRAAWQELHDGVRALAEEMATMPGGRRRRQKDEAKAIEEAERTTVPAASRLVEQVRARTLDLIGDHAGALAIVERELSSRRTS